VATALPSGTLYVLKRDCGVYAILDHAHHSTREMPIARTYSQDCDSLGPDELGGQAVCGKPEILTKGRRAPRA
jgi:hypothetical protein